ncbi:MAG: ribokinase [Sporichthyaceae bacterium]
MANQVTIIVVGSTMIDMMTYAERVPAAGETLVGDRFAQGFGGKGANQAVMASRLGAAVAMVNCVGDDVFGDTTLENLTREGIDVASVKRVAGVSSGVAPIWVEADGTNRIIVIPGANNEVTPEQARGAVEGAGAVQLVLGQFEIPQATTASAFAAARRRGAVTVLNPAPAAEMSPTLLEVTDWVIPNQVEFGHLARACGVEAARVDDDAITEMAARTTGRLVVTLGASGAAVCESDRVIRVAAPSARAVDTTGAGDAFVGAFSYGLARGLSAADAADVGCRCAAISVTRPGTQTSFPSIEELAELRRELRLGD